MDVVVMGESTRINDFAESTSRLGSIVQINSISIDFSSSMKEIELPVHEHFSIRGFVAGMRKKDRKACFPFASEGNDVVDYLPPLFVPEFRWWQCSSCIQNDEMKTTSEEMVAATKCDVNTNSCQNVGGKDGLFIRRKENTGNKGKPDFGDIDGGNSGNLQEVNTRQVIEMPNDNQDATGVVCLDTFSVQQHRRKPKLRSLADIMVEERIQITSPRTRSTSSCGMQVPSMMEADLVPQLEVDDVSSDIAKVAQSPERKKKIGLGEDREPLASTCPRAVDKRTKGLMVDAEKNSKRTEISDPESKGDTSMKLDSPRTQRFKPKKSKAIDANKKIRLIRKDEVAQERQCLQPNNVSSVNSQEQVVHVETNLSKIEGSPSTLVATESRLRSSLPGQEMEKISDHGSDNGPLLPTREGILGNCDVRGVVALDLSLNNFMNEEGNHSNRASSKERRCIPDLNVEYPGKTDMTEEQDSTILSEKRTLPLQKPLDASASYCRESVREGKRISEPKNQDNNVEHGPSDDIPMEIVELLAKNQHERGLGNSRRCLLGKNDATQGFSAINVRGNHCTTDLPLPSRINGFKVANGDMGLKSTIGMDMSKPEKGHFRLSSSSTPSHLRKPECSTSASVMAGPSSSIAWGQLLHSSSRENVTSRLNIPQHRPILPSGMRPRSFLDECRIKDGKGKKGVVDVAKLNEGRVRSNYTSVGSLDPYSNNTIPAMQLLSLMDQRGVSTSSHKVGLDKPFSPCKHHPSLNGKENHSVLRGSDFPLLRYGVYSSGESSFRASSNSKAQAPQEVKNSRITVMESLGDCTLNRNPAEFSVPEVRNEFTISAKDLRPRKRKRNTLKENLQNGNVDGRKRQRMRKST